MSVDDKDFKKLHFLIAKIAEDANIVGTIQHINVVDSIDLLRKEASRQAFIEREKHD